MRALVVVIGARWRSKSVSRGRLRMDDTHSVALTYIREAMASGSGGTLSIMEYATLSQGRRSRTVNSHNKYRR